MLNRLSKVSINELITSEKWLYLLSFVLLRKLSLTKVKGINSVLHYVCKFRPPLYIIKRLHKANPKNVFEKDDKERFALHIACKHGCCPEVIKYLVKKNPDAAKKSDKKYRTPIHLACKSYVQKSDKEWDTANHSLIKVAQDLIDAAPFSATREDNKGNTALEYAIESKLSLLVIRFLEQQYKCNQRELLDESVDIENRMYYVKFPKHCHHDRMQGNNLRNKHMRGSKLKPAPCATQNQSRARAA